MGRDPRLPPTYRRRRARGRSGCRQHPQAQARRELRGPRRVRIRPEAALLRLEGGAVHARRVLGRRVPLRPLDGRARATSINDAIVARTADRSRTTPSASRSSRTTPTDPDDLTGLNGFRRLPEDGVVEWRYFLHGVEVSGRHELRRRGATELQDRHDAQPSAAATCPATRAAGPTDRRLARRAQPPARASTRSPERPGRRASHGHHTAHPGPGVREDIAVDQDGWTTRDPRRESFSRGRGAARPLWFYVLKEAADAGGEGSTSARSAPASSPRC